jgi:hypothetical protein
MYKKYLIIYLEWLGIIASGGSIGILKYAFDNKNTLKRFEIYSYIFIGVMILLTSGILLLMLVNSKDEKNNSNNE